MLSLQCFIAFFWPLLSNHTGTCHTAKSEATDFLTAVSKPMTGKGIYYKLIRDLNKMFTFSLFWGQITKPHVFNFNKIKCPDASQSIVLFHLQNCNVINHEDMKTQPFPQIDFPYIHITTHNAYLNRDGRSGHCVAHTSVTGPLAGDGRCLASWQVLCRLGETDTS